MANVQGVIPLSEGAWLKEVVAKSGLSSAEFAQRLGVSRATLFVWFSKPVINASVEQLLTIIELLGWDEKREFRTEWKREQEHHGSPYDRELASRDWRLKLMNHIRWRVDDRWRSEQEDQMFVEVKTRRIPYFRKKIPASGWIDVGDPQTLHEADGYELVDANTPRDAFALQIEGDCMEPDFPSGSIIIFLPIRPGDHGAQFESGKPYYFQQSDGNATFKKVFYEPPKERYRLECINKKYKPMYAPEQLMARMSRAIKVIRDVE